MKKKCFKMVIRKMTFDVGGELRFLSLTLSFVYYIIVTFVSDTKEGQTAPAVNL